MKNKEYYIKHLGLKPHPEGGYYKETYRSEIAQAFDGFSAERNACTGIYFLLEHENFSAFHRIQSDEMWHFYAGDPLTVHMINESGEYTAQKVGMDLEAGELPQFVVPAKVWFASEVEKKGGFSLVGCTVSPGFDFNDFELADTSLETRFPNHRNIIRKLIRF